MDIGQVIVWALLIAIAVNLFFSVTGLGTILAKLVKTSPTEEFLMLKIKNLESRVAKLESEQNK